MQVAATETLVRLIKKEDREEFGRKCFLTEAVFESFLSIRDVRFEVVSYSKKSKVNSNASFLWHRQMARKDPFKE